jgi:phospholipid transport system substrate-binding protein
MNPTYRYVVVWSVLSSLLLIGLIARIEAGEPQEKIRETVNAVLDVLNDASLQGPAHTQERRAKIRQAVLQRFGFEEMAQRAMGVHWRKLTPEQKQEFVPLFSDLLERSYINKIEGYGGSKENIRYTKESVDKDGYAAVLTEIVTRDLNVEVEYRLLQRDGEWNVYDVVIEGVSLVNNYRTQFNKIIRQESYEALVKQMKQKLEQEEAIEGPKN